MSGNYMRLFKPKYENIWDASVSEYGSNPTTEKDWTKIDLLGDKKIATKYKEIKKRASTLEEMLDKLTDKYEENKKSRADTDEILEFMDSVIELLKIEYFFIHSLQEIIAIRELTK